MYRSYGFYLIATTLMLSGKTLAVCMAKNPDKAYTIMLVAQIVFFVIGKIYFLLCLRSIQLNELDKLSEIDAALAASYN